MKGSLDPGGPVPLYGWWGCCQYCPFSVKESSFQVQGSQCELDYETGVTSFLVDVVVWRRLYLGSCLSLEAFQALAE